MFKSITFFILIFMSLNLFAVRFETSIMDPHFPYKKGPWFEGWYTRITDAENGKSFAVISGVYFKSNRRYVKGDTFKGYLGVIVSEKGKAPQIFEVFPEEITLKTHGGNLVNGNSRGKVTDFEFRSKFGLITQNMIDIKIFEKVRVNAKVRSRVSWIRGSEAGPTGMTDHLRFFPLHWYVYSTTGSVDYFVDYLNKYNEKESFEGRGVAHQEKNWGTGFPLAWIWGHGVNESEQYFALSGGENKLGPLNTEFWVFGYRSTNLKIDFSLKKKRNFKTSIEGCSGLFTLEGKKKDYIFKLVAKANPSTFGKLAIPGLSGFVRDGGEESFETMFHIEIYKKNKLIERAIFNGAALEFGAGYKCVRKERKN